MVSVVSRRLDDVDVLHRRLVHVRVFLDRTDQVRNSRACCSRSHSADPQSRPMRKSAPSAARAVSGSSMANNVLQRFRLDVSARQIGSELPQIVLPVTAQQGIDLLFQIARRQRRRAEARRTVQAMSLPAFRFPISVPQFRSRRPNSWLAVPDPFQNHRAVGWWRALRQTRDCSVHAPSPAESFPSEASRSRLLLHPRGFADPVRHQAHERVGQFGHFLHQFRK